MHMHAVLDCNAQSKEAVAAGSENPAKRLKAEAKPPTSDSIGESVTARAEGACVGNSTTVYFKGADGARLSYEVAPPPEGTHTVACRSCDLSCK